MPAAALNSPDDSRCSPLAHHLQKHQLVMTEERKRKMPGSSAYKRGKDREDEDTRWLDEETRCPMGLGSLHLAPRLGEDPWPPTWSKISPQSLPSCRPGTSRPSSSSSSRAHPVAGSTSQRTIEHQVVRATRPLERTQDWLGRPIRAPQAYAHPA